MNGESSRHSLGSHAEAFACRGVHCLGALCRRSADPSAVVLSRLSVGIYFLARHSGGMLGAAHAASSRGRTMGFYDSARVGSGDTNLAAHGPAFRPACCSACPISTPGREPKSLRPIRCCNKKLPISICLSLLPARWSISPFGSSWDACSSHGHLQQDRTADDTLTQRLQRLSGPGLVLYGLTVTFSAIDWVMSLEPKWYSTIFGMIFMVSYGLAALALAILVTRFLKGKAPRPRGIAGPLARSRQSLARSGHVLGVPEFFSVLADLVGKSGRRDPLVSAPHRRRLGVGCHRLDISFSLRLPFVLLLSRNTKATRYTGGGRCGDPFHALAGHSVDGGAVLLSRRDSTSTGWISWRRSASAVFGSPHFIGYLKARSLLPLHDPRFAELLEQAQEA